MSEIIIMRNEILESGAPLPLATLLDEKQSTLTIGDEGVVQLWAETIQSINGLVQAAIPDVHVLGPELWRLEDQKEAVTDGAAFTVTLDSYSTFCLYQLGVSRHFKPGGKVQSHVGLRPGHKSIVKQVADLRKAAQGRPITLLEDDMFTGGTASFVINTLQSAGLEVEAFVPGLQASGVDEINGVPVVPIERLSEGVLDIVDPRDLLFGLPEAGLVTNVGPNLYRAPYCLPYIDITMRASIVEPAAKEFSLSLTRLNKVFFTRLQELLGKTIFIRDLSPQFQTFVDVCCPEITPDMTIAAFCIHTQRLIGE